jgi:hypothetical protein
VFTAQSCNILPGHVKAERQLFAVAFEQDIAVDAMDYSARRLFAENIQRLMDANPSLGSPAKLAKHCRWPSGRKKGELVSERNIRYALDTRTDAIPPIPSPTLDLLIAIANAFQVPAWQMLADDRLLKLWNLGKLFTISEGVADAEVEKHLPLPPREPHDRDRSSGD